MICINCSHPKTSVTNSRPHKTTPSVWRRRQCTKCHTLVTTYERIDVADQLLIQGRPFSMAKLTVNLFKYLPQSSSQADEALALAQTIGESLLLDKRQEVTTVALTERIWSTLSRYNTKSGLKYGLDYDCVETR